MTIREMPCLMLRSQSCSAGSLYGFPAGHPLEEMMGELQAPKEGLLGGGLLMPLGWRETLESDDFLPDVVATDAWEEDDDVVDDDDDDDEEEDEEDDDFFPDDADEFEDEEEEDDDDDEDEDEDE